jgi:hypothetical protein
MSGIEVAGLLLGYMPALMKSLEAFRKLQAPGEESQRLLTDTQIESVMFRRVIEETLSTVFDPDQVDEMVENPNSELWRDATTRAAFRESLGPSTDIFMSLLGSYEEKIARIERDFQRVGLRMPKMTIETQIR